jgi:DNA-binding response OmpR family regulator
VRILLVEDEPDLAGPIVRLLEREGYDVTAVRSVADARGVAVDAVDVVLMDVMLPEGEDAGFAFARSLRDAGYAGGLLFLTARDTAGDRLHAQGVGAAATLIKPFSLRDLLTRVRAFASP